MKPIVTRLNKRIAHLEGHWGTNDGACTVEQLCRMIWQRDKGELTGIAEGAYSCLASQFEHEEAERARR